MSKLVGLLFEAWKDLDCVLDGLDPADAVRQIEGGSSFAWTLAHVTQTMDAWINVRFQQLGPNSLIGQDRFGYGGTGAAEDWLEVLAGVKEVREMAQAYLQSMDEYDLDLVIPYDGSRSFLHGRGLGLRHALLRLCAHHYFHIGAIASKQVRLGHEVGDYPGALEEAI